MPSPEPNNCNWCGRFTTGAACSRAACRARQSHMTRKRHHQRRRKARRSTRSRWPF